ncbi:hypothetical protein VTJ49DRAFT_4251 [Mycothermus thermophilus]|uniref:Putative zinc-finger domain-containing protein n=1 Tax=Humicola insolens TaxID=85995 RepID=A0ABR3VLY3_HUMIN
MSQYPLPYGYGQYHGQPPPPNPYSFPTASDYAPPSHNVQYNPHAAQENRDATHAAFEQNGHNQAGHQACHNGVNHLAQRLPDQPPSRPAQASRSAPDSDLEEGELSEGQFEDLYEPQEYASDTPAQPVPGPILRRPPTGDPSQPASAVDTPDGGFYESDEEENRENPQPPEAVRDRSASYSPFLSPREPQSDVATPQSGPDKPAPVVCSPKADISPGATVSTLQPANHAAPAPSTHLARPAGPAPATVEEKDPLAKCKSLQEAKKEAQKAILQLRSFVKYQDYIDEGLDQKFIQGLFRALHLDIPKSATDSTTAEPKEAGKQQAGGATDTNKPDQVVSATPQAEESTEKEKTTSTMPVEPPKGEERKDRIARLLAEREARTKANPKPPAVDNAPKQTAPTGPAQGLTTATASTPDSAGPKTKQWGEKERLLQQKIAALNKAREAQQKSANNGSGPGSGATTPVSPATTPLTVPTGPRAVLGSQSTNVAPPWASYFPSPAKHHPPPGFIRNPTNVPQPSPNIAHLPTGPRATQSPAQLPIPGLSIPPNPNHMPVRKRPVASDFVDDYSPSSVPPPKRPFGQVRPQETSLIIHMSDDEDDGDVSMDAGSQADETSVDHPRPPSRGLVRGHTLRDFPPLPDTTTYSPRQFSSPAPSVTPPSGVVNNNNKAQTELELKQKAIEEMKRKIALAEARKKLKQVVGGSVTPKPATPSSEVKDNNSTSMVQSTESGNTSERSNQATPQPTQDLSTAKLPKPSEIAAMDPTQRAQLRGRLLSCDLPRVESTLTEKMKRLEQLRDEEARLKAEIDKELAEKKRLAEELQQLDAASPAASAQQDGSRQEREAVESPSLAPETDGHEERVSQTAGDAVGSTESESVETPPTSDKGQSSAKEVATVAECVPEQVQAAGSTTEEGHITSETEKVTTAEESHAEPTTENAIAEPATTTNDTAPPAEEPKDQDMSELTTTEQVDAAVIDETTPMELESRSPSPETAEPGRASDAEHTDAEPMSAVGTEPSASVLEQISSVAHPREAVQEIEAEAAANVEVVSPGDAAILRLTRKQVPDKPAPAASSSVLKPYESPLRYFRDYRFHPEFQNTVAGGLKSLTYSNRMDPFKELCPYELGKHQCPENCEFQHFADMVPADDHILLELGNPDEFEGEEKVRFIEGLREVLQKFKADKVKDFDVIARGIIEFRAKFLGDPSRVLSLGHVKI